jgi:ribosome biogenesis GTPase
LNGVVVKSTGSWIRVKSEDGAYVDCKLKGIFRFKGIRTTNPVAIGDRVEYEITRGQTGALITKIHERENYIIRKATKLSKTAHIIAANIDHAYLIVTLAYPKTSTGFIDRFLVTATGYFIPVSLVFNKIDLYDEDLEQTEKELKEIYNKAGYPCYSVSALRGDHIPDLKEMMKSKINLFAGYSGAGKSAIIMAIEPALELKTATISEAHLKGRHTTTFAEMLELTVGGYIIDTPGIKEFGLIDFDKTEIHRCFPEMDRLLPQCQYKNCTHIHEPGCAVKEALKSGEVSEMRYYSYLSILNELDQ